MTNLLVIHDWIPDQLANGSHGHWSIRQKKLKAAQVMVWAAAKQDNLQPVAGRARVTITFVFSVNRRRDTDNLYSRAKGIVDGLVKGHWIEDDNTSTLDLVVNAAVDPGHKATRIHLESAP